MLRLMILILTLKLTNAYKETPPHRQLCNYFV
nr:MAG TPA: hypothetical protein [Bacteriophage sp.]